MADAFRVGEPVARPYDVYGVAGSPVRHGVVWRRYSSPGYPELYAVRWADGCVTDGYLPHGLDHDDEPVPPSELTFEQIEKVWRAASAAMERALIRRAAEWIRETMPTAAKLICEAGNGDEGQPILRILRVVDADGAVLHDVENPHSDELVDTCDQVDLDLLDWLITLDEDGYSDNPEINLDERAEA